MTPSEWSAIIGAAIGALVAWAVWRKGRPAAEPTASEDGASTLTIIIPAHNEEAVIGHTVRSMADAAPPEAELVVVNDGSTDATATILARLQNEIPRLQVLTQPAAQGKPAALNRALSETRGEVILFLDADARMDAEGFRFYPSVLATEGRGGVFANPSPYNAWRSLAVVVQELAFAFLRVFRFSGVFGRPGFMACGLFMKRDVLQDAGSFRFGSLSDDFDLWIRLGRTGGRVRFVRGPHCRIQYAPSFPDFFRQLVRWTWGALQEMLGAIRQGSLGHVGTIVVMGIALYAPQVVVLTDLVLGEWILTPHLLPGLAVMFWIAVISSYLTERPPVREALFNLTFGLPLMLLLMQASVLVAAWKAVGRTSVWHKVSREPG